MPCPYERPPSFARRRSGSPKRLPAAPRVRLAIAFSTLLWLVGCGGEAGGDAWTGVRIDLAVDPSGTDACRIERVARIDQDATPLYMVRGEAGYSAPDHPLRRIPIQIQFRGIEGVVTDRAVTLTDLPVACSDVSIEMAFEECVAMDRSAVDCPPIELRGQDAFATVRVLPAE